MKDSYSQSIILPLHIVNQGSCDNGLATYPTNKAGYVCAKLSILSSRRGNSILIPKLANRDLGQFAASKPQRDTACKNENAS